MLNLNMPNLPYDTLISLVIATVLGVGFSFFRRSGLLRFLLSIVASCLGFWLGQLIGTALQFQFLMWGGVHLVEGILGSLLLLYVVNS